VDILSSLHRDDELTIIEPEPKWTVVTRSVHDGLKAAILAESDDFHRKNPNLSGMRKSDLKSRLMPRAPQILLDKLLDDLADAGKVEVEGETVRVSGFQVSFSPDQEQLKEWIEQVYAERRFTPPQPEELALEFAKDVKQIDKIVAGLCEIGILIKLYGPDGKPFYFHKRAIDEARQMLVDFFNDHSEMRFFEFRELLGSTRKFTTPLAMHFDAIGLTYREGEVRKMIR